MSKSKTFYRKGAKEILDPYRIFFDAFLCVLRAFAVPRYRRFLFRFINTSDLFPSGSLQNIFLRKHVAFYTHDDLCQG